jgi:hypothetical protein
VTEHRDRERERRTRDEEEENKRRAETERRGEELRASWRKHHPEKEREKSRPKKGRPS